MLEGKVLDKAIEQMMQRLRSVNLLYIRKVAMQIRKIGELGQASINRLVAMADFNADIAEIKERLRLIAAVNAKELRQVLTKAVNETYTDPRFRRYLAEYPLKNAQRQRIERYVQTVYRQTAARMYNFSNTTAVTQGYSDAVDKAILATSTGVASYTETMRDTIRELGHAGLQVQYESGYHRRLDTAVRQNIVDAVNQINKNASIMIGEEINAQAGEDVYDAIEISAHARSAPDHEPVQGHVFMLEEYEKMQSGLMFRDIDGKVYEGFRRPIGEWNCRHTPLSFSTKWSKRTWTDEQLQAFIDENQTGCVIDGKHRTLYEAMQMMRDIETAVRREKDTAVAAQAAGDDALRQECQRNINALVRRYAEIAKASGNAEKRQRMTVEGFRMAKVPKDSGKVLTSETENGKMESELGRFQKALREDKNISDRYYAVIKGRFVSSPRYAREAYYKFVPERSVIDSSYKGVPHFYEGDANHRPGVYMDYAQDVNNPKGNGGTWFHEHAHMIDCFAGYLSHKAEFYDALKTDFANLISARTEASVPLSYFDACETVRNTSGLASLIEREIMDFRSQHGVSDIIHGLSDTMIHGCAGHPTPGYWNGLTIPEEAFAHMYESLSDKLGYTEMQKYFPSALNVFEEMLKEAVK